MCAAQDCKSEKRSAICDGGWRAHSDIGNSGDDLFAVLVGRREHCGNFCSRGAREELVRTSSPWKKLANAKVFHHERMCYPNLCQESDAGLQCVAPLWYKGNASDTSPLDPQRRYNPTTGAVRTRGEMHSAIMTLAFLSTPGSFPIVLARRIDTPDAELPFDDERIDILAPKSAKYVETLDSAVPVASHSQTACKLVEMRAEVGDAKASLKSHASMSIVGAALVEVQISVGNVGPRRDSCVMAGTWYGKPRHERAVGNLKRHDLGDAELLDAEVALAAASSASVGWTKTHEKGTGFRYGMTSSRKICQGNGPESTYSHRPATVITSSWCTHENAIPSSLVMTRPCPWCATREADNTYASAGIGVSGWKLGSPTSYDLSYESELIHGGQHRRADVHNVNGKGQRFPSFSEREKPRNGGETGREGTEGDVGTLKKTTWRG
ncbi:hypothetical protein BJY52DRAFT_1416784 [Lactarius psammicola]|nr:hypothetical protein BJY52DRAFT_1416784 [Lactarius psammicola]